MMQKAIVSLLWGTQIEALRQFLLMHEPMVVIIPEEPTPQIRSVIDSTGSTVVGLQGMLDAARHADSVAETSQLNTRFATYLGTLASENPALSQMTEVIADTVATELPAAVRLLYCLAEAAKRYEIGLLVTSEDVTNGGKTATSWAKARGIPTLHVAHAIALVDPYTVHDQVIADKLAVFGQRGMEGYLDQGYPAERFVVTGNPAWDCYAELRNRKPACRQYLDGKYPIRRGIPLIVFGTTWSSHFSAQGNENVYDDTLAVFIASCEALRASGLQFNAIIKDRSSNGAFGEQRYRQILRDLGAADSGYVYCMDDTQALAAGSDLLIATDSNYLVEGMLARTPVINLLSVTGMVMGPSFEAETGVTEVEAQNLAGAIHLLLTNETVRAAAVNAAAARVKHYNATENGTAATCVAELMARMAAGLTPRAKRHVWQEYLDVESSSTRGLYHTAGRADLANMLTNTPSVILDVGCATGSNAALVKERFPGSRAFGIEMNREAAKLAGEKLDHVMVGRFEDFDLEKEGIARGSLDAVLLADVLEHMYNPWDVMVKLREYMSPTGQLVLSIPNIRNLWIMEELGKGNWSYADAGLLDITHIRFFTRNEMVKFCEETGYRIVQTSNSLDGRLRSFWPQNQTQTGPFNIDLTRLTLKNVTREELLEYYTLQYYLLIEKAPDAARIRTHN
ncbi:MAG: class I SAM-dependent methyltransferase [Paraburkholderia sp.]|uniref:class I SAM-dependent methyltransferase n=1 Tax=Paraburkholderia sp. TaxID=1926495 RepID=UPI001228492A|nr:class I SAM-dependent methyltransferase [Paraburkholderia sp.]TAM06627.1 MAG: class I SAM-dependent methyltransferase [Paraburkholderia sp.]TAM28491.1 MAG: class I SAM-dependent methyltransferase [Paraburkholderia sp.]